MARNKKAKPLKLKRQSDPDARRRAVRLGGHLLLACIALGGMGAGYYYADSYVRQRVALRSQPLIIVLKNRPPWMNDFLVEQIAAIARPPAPHSSFDHQLLVDTAQKLGRNRWVRKVHSVRRAYTHGPGDTLEIDCEYRAPVALVRSGPFYWLVDEDGVRLSERFTDDDLPSIQHDPGGHTRIRVIEGVRAAAPHEPGEKWMGDDLAAGLKMLRYLFDKPYTDQIIAVNVANFGGRVDAKAPQIVLQTQYQTRIWWGRPPAENDVDSFIEVPTARKLEYLRLTFEQYGRVDANHKCLDIRFDKITYLSEEEPTPPARSTPRRATQSPH